MSYWGATVITNLLSAIPFVGNDLVQLAWGGFCVDNATLNRFFSLHYLMPFVLAALVLVHIMALHEHASNNPLGISSNSDRITFHPYFTFKDLVGFIAWMIALALLVFYVPNMLGQFAQNFFVIKLVAVLSLIAYYYKIAICWKTCQIYGTNSVSGSLYTMFSEIPANVKTLKFKQSAGNHILGSSETTRDLSSKIESTPDFYTYLAGLVDGDGSFGVSSEKKIPYFEITLHEKDVKTLYFIKQNLGFGQVSKRSKVKAYRYRTGSYINIYKVLTHLNGYLLTREKIESLNTFANFLKTKNIQFKPIIPDEKTSLYIINNSSWLSGFFDAEGCFLIFNKYTLTINISQKNVYILSLIKKSLNLGHIRFDKSWSGYIYTISDIKGVDKILYLFSVWPLKTVKNIDVKTFKRLSYYIHKNFHTSKNLEEIKTVDIIISVFKNRYKASA